MAKQKETPIKKTIDFRIPPVMSKFFAKVKHEVTDMRLKNNFAA